MYIYYDIKTNKVVGQPSIKPFVYFDKNLYNECYVESLPHKKANQYFTVANVREETKVIKEAYTQEEPYYNEETGLDEVKVVEYPAVTKTYITCDLVVNDRPQVSEEVKAQIIAKRKAIKEIEELKQLLTNTDYQAIKYAEGCYTEEEYAEIRILRQSYRDRINELEKII